jgi:hypothetical protein
VLLRFDRWLTTSTAPATSYDLAAAAERPRRPALGRRPRQRRHGRRPSRRPAVVAPSDQRRPPRGRRAVRVPRANPVEARRMLGPSPGRRVTDAHAAGWFRQVPASRTNPPSTPGTTSTTTPSPRSRCAAAACCRASSRCRSPAARHPDVAHG